MQDIRVPAAGASEAYKLGWLAEARQDADQFNKSQRAYPTQMDAMEMVLGQPVEQIPDGMSRIRVPRAKRNIRELVSSLSNLRPNASNKTENARFY